MVSGEGKMDKHREKKSANFQWKLLEKKISRKQSFKNNKG